MPFRNFLHQVLAAAMLAVAASLSAATAAPAGCGWGHSLGKSRAALTLAFESKGGFKFQMGKLKDGQDRALGQSSQIPGALVEVIGPASAPCKATCMVAIGGAHAKPGGVFIRQFVDTFDTKAGTWLAGATTDAKFRNGEPVSKSIGGKTYTLTLIPSMSMVMITVEG